MILSCTGSCIFPHIVSKCIIIHFVRTFECCNVLYKQIRSDSRHFHDDYIIFSNNLCSLLLWCQSPCESKRVFLPWLPFHSMNEILLHCVPSTPIFHNGVSKFYPQPRTKTWLTIFSVRPQHLQNVVQSMVLVTLISPPSMKNSSSGTNLTACFVGGSSKPFHKRYLTLLLD